MNSETSVGGVAIRITQTFISNSRTNLFKTWGVIAYTFGNDLKNAPKKISKSLCNTRYTDERTVKVMLTLACMPATTLQAERAFDRSGQSGHERVPSKTWSSSWFLTNSRVVRL